jgi:hypothetical protein
VGKTHRAVQTVIHGSGGRLLHAQYNRICRKEYGVGQKRSEKAEEVLHAGQAHKRQAGQGVGRADPSQGTKHEATQKPLDEMRGASGLDYAGLCRTM